jgi:hypothetical protein
MMHGHEKSDLAIVATKPANKAERSAAEPVERRAGAKGNAGQQGTHRTQNRASVSQALERIRRAVGNRARDITLTVTHLRWEPYALIGHVRICAGGAQQWASLPRQGESGMRAGAATGRCARFQPAFATAATPAASGWCRSGSCYWRGGLLAAHCPACFPVGAARVRQEAHPPRSQSLTMCREQDGSRHGK